jgi:hypothetical protein
MFFGKHKSEGDNNSHEQVNQDNCHTSDEALIQNETDR